MENQIKIIHVFSAPQSAFFFMDKQLDYLHDKGCEIHVIIPNDNFYSNKFKIREKNVITHFVSIKREISILSDLNTFFSLFFLFIRLKGDIIHLHTPKASFIGALAARLAFQKTIIYQMHGLVSAVGNKPQKNAIYYLEKATCQLVTKVFAVSNSLMQFAINNNYCIAKKIKVIGNGTINGIDYECRFNPSKVLDNEKYLKNEITNNKFVVGFIGRISIDKGIEDYLSVFNLLKEKIPILGVIVGPNESGKDLQTLLKSYNLLLKNDNLLIFDHIFDPQNIICSFDVLLFPTKREGFGLVAAEANALEVPVVAYDIPGVRDAIEKNVTGILVDYGNIKDLSQALLDYYTNPSKRKKHGHNGRKRVKRLFKQKNLWNEIFKEYKELYQRLN